MIDAHFSLGVIILAAGRSTRMGGPKLLLPWGKTSILGHLIRQWQALGAEQIAVVCAADDSAIHTRLDELLFPADNRIDNPAAERGMFSSIQCAAQWRGWQPSLTHWAIVLGDQPHLRPETLSKLLEFAAVHSGQICQPIKGGQRHHPALLPKSAFFDLAVSSSKHLKAFLAARTVAGCECDDPGLGLDIDRPQDYQEALAISGLKF